MSKEATIRELFVEELTEVRGGAKPGHLTTMACCEEGPFGCCGETTA